MPDTISPIRLISPAPPLTSSRHQSLRIAVPPLSAEEIRSRHSSHQFSRALTTLPNPISSLSLSVEVSQSTTSLPSPRSPRSSRSPHSSRSPQSSRSTRSPRPTQSPRSQLPETPGFTIPLLSPTGTNSAFSGTAFDAADAADASATTTRHDDGEVAEVVVLPPIAYNHDMHRYMVGLGNYGHAAIPTANAILLRLCELHKVALTESGCVRLVRDVDVFAELVPLLRRPYFHHAEAEIGRIYAEGEKSGGGGGAGAMKIWRARLSPQEREAENSRLLLMTVLLDLLVQIGLNLFGNLDSSLTTTEKTDLLARFKQASGYTALSEALLLFHSPFHRVLVASCIGLYYLGYQLPTNMRTPVLSTLLSHLAIAATDTDRSLANPIPKLTRYALFASVVLCTHPANLPILFKEGFLRAVTLVLGHVIANQMAQPGSAQKKGGESSSSKGGSGDKKTAAEGEVPQIEAWAWDEEIALCAAMVLTYLCAAHAATSLTQRNTTVVDAGVLQVLEPVLNKIARAYTFADTAETASSTSSSGSASRTHLPAVDGSGAGTLLPHSLTPLSTLLCLVKAVSYYLADNPEGADAVMATHTKMLGVEVKPELGLFGIGLGRTLVGVLRYTYEVWTRSFSCYFSDAPAGSAESIAWLAAKGYTAKTAGSESEDAISTRLRLHAGVMHAMGVEILTAGTVTLSWITHTPDTISHTQQVLDVGFLSVLLDIVEQYCLVLERVGTNELEDSLVETVSSVLCHITQQGFEFTTRKGGGSSRTGNSNGFAGYFTKAHSKGGADILLQLFYGLQQVEKDLLTEDQHRMLRNIALSFGFLEKGVTFLPSPKAGEKAGTAAVKKYGPVLRYLDWLKTTPIEYKQYDFKKYAGIAWSYLQDADSVLERYDETEK